MKFFLHPRNLPIGVRDILPYDVILPDGYALS